MEEYRSLAGEVEGNHEGKRERQEREATILSVREHDEGNTRRAETYGTYIDYLGVQYV